MNKSKVAIVKCDTYDEEDVQRAVEAGLDLLGGLSLFVKPGERIVMKPNVLIGSNPEKCVTTHPAVFKAVGRLLQGAGAKRILWRFSKFWKAWIQLEKGSFEAGW